MKKIENKMDNSLILEEFEKIEEKLESGKKINDYERRVYLRICLGNPRN